MYRQHELVRDCAKKYCQRPAESENGYRREETYVSERLFRYVLHMTP